MATVKALIRYGDTGRIEEVRVGDVLSNTAGGSGATQRTFAFFMS